MKIRTDFVTNSSSSSFVVELDVILDDGTPYKAYAETSSGGEGDGWIIPENKDDGVEIPIESIQSLEKMNITVNGTKRKVAEGELRLKCHTFGEYFFESDPNYMISRYLGPEWRKVIQLLETEFADDNLPDDLALKKMKEIPILSKYDDHSLLELRTLPMCKEDHCVDTEVTQSLHKNGTMSLNVITDDSWFELWEIDDFCDE